MHLFAPVTCRAFPTLEGIVLFELSDTEGRKLWLEIRYSSYADKHVEGDHMHIESLEDAKQYIEEVYGVAPYSWRSLTDGEAAIIDASIK